MTILPLESEPLPGVMKFIILVEGILVYITAFSFSSTCAEVEKIFENWSNFSSFGPTPTAPWVQES